MCGRYTVTVPLEQLAFRFGFDPAGPAGDLRPRYNVAPAQEVLAVLPDGERRLPRLLRWGLIPSWAKDPGIGARLINARIETVAEKPAFRQAVRRRRCLVPADGFIEWRRQGGRRDPFWFRLRSGEPFAFAGLWEVWTPQGGPALASCTILTTAANALVAAIHDRMPVILPAEAEEDWLDPTAPAEALLAALREPYPAEAMEVRPANPRVNSPRNDDPGCLAPEDP